MCLCKPEKSRRKEMCFSVWLAEVWADPSSEVKEVRGERWHKRANPKPKVKHKVGQNLHRGMWDFCDKQEYLGLTMKDEKKERDNWRIGEKNPHSYTVFTSLQAAKGLKIVRRDTHSLSQIHVLSVADIWIHRKCTYTLSKAYTHTNRHLQLICLL